LDTFLGVPARGWIALSIWVLVMTVPWAYVLWFLKRIDRSGVARWGAKGAGGEGSSSGPGSPER
jgi:hypothetical protein